MRVQSCIKGEHFVATVHGDDITIGGERSPVELVIKMVSRKFEIKKQVIGEDANLVKGGRILNCVFQWGRDGITADQRRLHHALWKGRMRAAQEVRKARKRTDGNRDILKPSTSGTAWVTVMAGTDRRWKVTTPMTARHSQVATSRLTDASPGSREQRRGAHCLKVWTKKQQVVSLSNAESELYAAVKTASEGIGNSERGKGLGDSMLAGPTSGCLSDDVPGQSQRIGQGETRRHAKPEKTGGIHVKKIRHEESRHERENRRLNDRDRKSSSF